MDRHAGAPCGGGEGERRELVPRAGWQADEHGPCVRAVRAGCVIRGADPARDGGAGGVLGRHGDGTGLPGVAERAEGGEQVDVGHRLEGRSGPHLVHYRLQRGRVHGSGGGHESFDELAGVLVHGGRADTGCGLQREIRIGDAAQGRCRCAWCPALVHEPAHHAHSPDGGLVIEAVAGRGPSRRNDFVAALPCTEELDTHSGAIRSLADGVHGLYRVRLRQRLDKVPE